MFCRRHMLSRRHLFVVLCLLLVLSPAPAVRVQATSAQWTILIYLDGDNNLERDAIDDFLEMAAIGSDANVNVIVQFDRMPGYDSRYGDWTGTLRFRVTQGMTPEAGNALADLGEANMGDPQTLADFMGWGTAAYPAQRMTLVLWNHGDGWRAASALKQRRKAICWDTTNRDDALDLAELRQVMATVTQDGAAPIDLLAFDACLMAMIEIDAQLQPYVRVRTASEETEPGTGYPFDTILADLRDHPEWEAAGLAQAIVERYYEAYGGETLSAIDLGSAYTALVTRVDELAQALIVHQATQLDVVQDVRREVQQFYGSYVDLYDFAEQLAAATGEEAIRAAAHGVMDAQDAVVLLERHGAYWPGAHGISIYFPADTNSWDSQYAGGSDYLTFTAQTQWDDFLIAYLELVTVCDPDVHEPDDEPSTATPIEVGGKPQRHNFCPATDAADWVAFQAQAGQAYEITTLELDAYCDTVLKLYDASGQTVLAQDDDGGAGWASRIEWTSPETATYYVQVIEYFGRTGQDTGYTLSVERLGSACAPDEYEPDEDPAAAAALSVDGTAQSRNFCPQDDLADWASFEAVQGQTYLIETRNLGPEANTVLTLYDTDAATELLTDDDGGDEPFASRLRWTCPADGQYFVRVHEREGRTGEGTDYELSGMLASLTIAGQVYLQGRSSHDGTQVTAQPISHAAPAITVTTSLSGTFALTTTAPCTVTAYHPAYLPEQWAIAETEASELILDAVTLLGGDINGDRRIDILDIAYIGAQFGGNDSRADVNADGVVDILDLVTAAANFGKVPTVRPVGP